MTDPEEPPAGDAVEPGGIEEAEEVTVEDIWRIVVGGLAGGVVGTALMTLVLFVVTALGPELPVFETLADFTGVPGNVLLGFLLFFAAGSVAWPLMFVTVGVYLPGRTRPRQGVLFGAVLWVGFVLAFSGRYRGLDLLVFLGFSVSTHLVYGYLLGLSVARFTGRYVTPELPV